MYGLDCKGVNEERGLPGNLSWRNEGSLPKTEAKLTDFHPDIIPTL